MLSCYHNFFNWLKEYEIIRKVPNLPKIRVKLGTRKVVTKKEQFELLDEVKRISYHINPKIWLGIKWMATYPSLRLEDFTKMTEDPNQNTNPPEPEIPLDDEEEETEEDAEDNKEEDKEIEEEDEIEQNPRIRNTELRHEMSKSYIDYAMSVIIGRAIPDVRDGLKPVQKRLLFSMYENNFTHKN